MWSTQIHSSTSFSVLGDFLWVSLCSESVNTAGLAAPRGDSPELLYEATFFQPQKVGQAPVSLLPGAHKPAPKERGAHPSRPHNPFIMVFLQLGINLAQKPGVPALGRGGGSMCSVLRGDASYHGWELLINKYAHQRGRWEQGFQSDI